MKSLLLLLCAMFAQTSVSQDTLRSRPVYLHSGKIGLGLDGITGSPNLLVKYFINNQLALQAIAGMDIDSLGGSAPPGYTRVTGLTVRGGLSVLFHLTQTQLSPYLGIEGVFQYQKQAGTFLIPPDPKNSIIGSCVFGGEFFLNEQFTLGIKQTLGANIRLKRDLPKEETVVMFNTSTLMTGRFYFN
jgi:hypothetical protein